MNVVPLAVTRSIGRAMLKTKKNSPHIFFAGGVVGVIGSGVLACRATLKLEKTLDEIKTDNMVAKEMKAGIGVQQYTEQEYFRFLGHTYTKAIIKFGRLYGPSVALGAASVVALTGSHVQLTRRNSALSATLALVSQAYDDYRVRVRTEVGEERELELFRDARTVVEEGEGKKKEAFTVVDPNRFSVYSKCFDETNVHWEKDPETNRIFLQMQQNYANHLLNARGHLFLNEVYDVLGFERTQAGQVVGWVRGGDGDNFVDFGLFEADNTRFINGLERSIFLDFNVDGVVYDKI